MKFNFRSVICLILVILLTQSCFAFITYGAVQFKDGTASSWAVPEITQAEQYGLTYDAILNNFKNPITREEFCIIVVKLYEKISGKTANSGQNPFKDTSNQEVVKAYLLGIVSGTGGGLFSPGNSITRQELCAMIFRTIKASLPNLPTDAPVLSGYNDTGKIASWADAAVRFCVKNGIINGVGAGLIDPLGKTTREQGIAIIKRTYERYKTPDFSKMPTIDVDSNPKPELSEKEKSQQLDLQNRLSSPHFNTKLTLYAATGEGKPSSLPVLSYNDVDPVRSIQLFSMAESDITRATPLIVNPNLNITKTITLKTGLRYSDAPFEFIDSNGDPKRYFAFILQAANTSKVVWQVAKAPFNGYPDSWKKPAGLVTSGETAASVKEFIIDFSKFAQSPAPPSNLFKLKSGQLLFQTSTAYRELPREQRTYYVRAVPVDSRGNCIGDPGTGIPLIYGKPAVDNHLAALTQPSFELWFADKSGLPSYTPSEFPNVFKHDGRIIGVSPNDSAYYFQPQKFDTEAAKLTLQVSTIPFKCEPAQWEMPSGLIYSKEYDTGAMPVVNGFNDSLNVKFSDFSPSGVDLGDKKITYYVRTVSTKTSESQPGKIEPMFSETRTVCYQNQPTVKIYPVKTITVPAYTPVMSFERYIPVRWENPGWYHFYEVFRAPKWYEINFKLKASNGSVLYPYPYYMLQGMSPEEYENQLVPQFLVKGSGFKVVEQGGSSWWGDLWDGIVNFFSSLVEIITDVVNWASNTYNSLKTGLISVVAKNFPLIPDGWRDELTTALTALADYGLASIGIPPNIPNFDELASGGLDYAISVATQEAGIPANALTDSAKDALGKEILSKMDESTAVSAPNPLNCPFIKPDHRYQYRPAYVDVKLYNNNPKPSPTGTLHVAVEYGKWPYYPIYDNVSLPVPSLQPNETTYIRVYLKEYMNKPYFGDIPFITSEFWDMYRGENSEKCDFNISISYNLPDAKSAAHAMGLDQNQGECILNYTYDKPYSKTSFTNTPCDEFFYWQLP